MKLISMLLLAAALFAAGCGGASSQKIDGSSEASFQKSLDEIRKTLSAGEKEKFNDALTAIGAKAFFGTLGNDSASPEQELMKALNGKTVSEVLAEADKLRAELKK